MKKAKSSNVNALVTDYVKSLGVGASFTSKEIGKVLKVTSSGAVSGALARLVDRGVIYVPKKDGRTFIYEVPDKNNQPSIARRKRRGSAVILAEKLIKEIGKLSGGSSLRGVPTKALLAELARRTKGD